MSYQDYVCGTKFRDLADYQFQENGTWSQENLHMEGKRFHVFYCHTHQFNIASNFIRNWKYPDSIILITHNSDGAVRDSSYQQIREHDADYRLLPKNVVRWYAQNVDVRLPARVTPIPIGLENRYCFDYDKAQMLFEEAEKKVDKKPLYVNFNVNTNLKARKEALEACQQHTKVCSVRLGQNGDDYSRYLSELHSHSGAICPRGNGIDCHRTWEALYLGVVPVMLFDEAIQSMDIPALFVNNWHELFDNYDDLKLALKTHQEAFNKPIEALSMKYWTHRINNAI